MSVNNQVRYGRILRPHCGNVKFPFFADDNMRLDSFRTWRGHQDRDLRNLVENGFFYTNVGDIVQCYVCGIVIGTWTVEMDPFLEHVRNAPYCRHLPELHNLEVIAEIKNQIFGIDRMRVPTNIPLDRNNDGFTGRRVKTTGHSSTDPPIYAGHSDHGDGQSDSSRISHEQGSGDAGDMATASVTEECAGELTRCLNSPGVHIGDVLNSPAALSLLQNGYDKESVTRAVVDLCEQGHMDFKSKDLLELINSWEE
ncbi:hypothetical protein ACJMK2_029481 [Sinanodonta woodiana]|uniref:Uncharacterized protein n=1 Tax=Sinanodonta woodiana TaxID=1069815 RepID=A0ABD3XAR3_SINWO